MGWINGMGCKGWNRIGGYMGWDGMDGMGLG